MAIKIEIRNLEQLNRVTTGLSKIRVGLYGMLEKKLADLGNRLIRQAKLNVTAGGISGLNVRTGRLRASINARLDKQDQAIALIFGANTPYARIHEYGGDIRTRFALIHIRKRSYLAPAVDAEYPRFVQRTKQLLREIAVNGIKGLD